MLQAEYQLCQATPLPALLPEDFHYAGVIAFAGAIANVEAPKWVKQPCPILLFHGDADRTVPYRQAALPGLGGLWGSATIAESLAAIHAPYTFYRIGNAGHEVSSTPMHNQLQDILSFLHRQVDKQEALAIECASHDPATPLQEQPFTIEDYLQENLP